MFVDIDAHIDTQALRRVAAASSARAIALMSAMIPPWIMKKLLSSEPGQNTVYYGDICQVLKASERTRFGHDSGTLSFRHSGPPDEILRT